MLYKIKIRCSEDGKDTYPISNIIISRGSHANFKSAILSIEEKLANLHNKYLRLECHGIEVHYREVGSNESISIQGEKVSRNLKDMNKKSIDSKNYSENKIPKQSDYNL
jgi:ERCC4-related helicase